MAEYMKEIWDGIRGYMTGYRMVYGDIYRIRGYINGVFGSPTSPYIRACIVMSDPYGRDTRSHYGAINGCGS